MHSQITQIPLDGRACESPNPSNKRDKAHSNSNNSSSKNHLRQALRSIQNAVDHLAHQNSMNCRENSDSYLLQQKLLDQHADEVIYNRKQFHRVQATLRERAVITTAALQHTAHQVLKERYQDMSRVNIEKDYWLMETEEASPKNVMDLFTFAATCREMGEEIPLDLPIFDNNQRL